MRQFPPERPERSVSFRLSFSARGSPVRVPIAEWCGYPCRRTERFLSMMSGLMAGRREPRTAAAVVGANKKVAAAWVAQESSASLGHHHCAFCLYECWATTSIENDCKATRNKGAPDYGLEESPIIRPGICPFRPVNIFALHSPIYSRDEPLRPPKPPRTHAVLSS
jgi:hypothetical protein